jgi:SAM-dependent methyltransferase
MTSRALRRTVVVFAAALSFAVVPSRAIAGQESEAILERLNRVGDLLKALDARPGALIADVGAGDGFYTVRIARAVAPGGRAVAVDVSESALGKLRERVSRENSANVDVVLGAADDPHLEAGRFDAVLVHNAYHEMSEHEAMLRHIRTALKPGGRFVIVEPMHDSSRGLTRDKQAAQHDIAIDIVDDDLRSAGFDVIERDNEFVKFTGVAGGFWLIVARPDPRGVDEFGALRFLVGDWIAIDTPDGERGGFTFTLGVQNHVMVRTNEAIYDATPQHPASRHDDLMVIYSENGSLKADYFDNEGHVIRYAVRPDGANRVVFVSDPNPREPRFRLTYTAGADGVLTGAFDVAAPGAPDAFKPYLSWHARRSR